MPSFPEKGPYEVIWDINGLNLTLSPFIGRVGFTTIDSFSPIEHEFTGSTMVDAVPTGTLSELSVPMAKPSYSKLYQIIPSVKNLGGGRVQFSAYAGGCSMYDLSKNITLKPIDCQLQVGVDPLEWILIHHCYPIREIDLGFDREEQRAWMVKFLCFSSQESGVNFGRIWDLGVAP